MLYIFFLILRDFLKLPCCKAQHTQRLFRQLKTKPLNIFPVGFRHRADSLLSEHPGAKGKQFVYRALRVSRQLPPNWMNRSHALPIRVKGVFKNPGIGVLHLIMVQTKSFCHVQERTFGRVADYRALLVRIKAGIVA